MFLSKKSSFFSGVLCGLISAPVYFLPGLLALSVLCRQIHASESRRQAVIFAYIFGFGFFLSSLYWISFGPMVYIKEFWWTIPFALLGLPAFCALFIALHGVLSWQFRNTALYHFTFCISWVFIEWVMSWIFTGLPWAMLGYGFAVSNTLSQASSIFGVIGLSFIAVYIGSAFFAKEGVRVRLVVSILVATSMFTLGYQRLKDNPTQFTDLKVRIVQPSIAQTDKWEAAIFWQNLDHQVQLSNLEGEPDIIVWSEAALTVPYHYKPVLDNLLSAFSKDKQVLISGGVNDNDKPDDYKVFSSLVALNSQGKLLFDYHKSHLVPFGEYIPFSNYLPLKKFTPGVIDYTPGDREVVHLEQFDLRIQPLICYEAVFYEEARIAASKADLIINVTNDAWYGNSSGPYQHLEISRMRSIENGLPMIRAANNGISAIIDPVGRVIAKTQLDKVEILDSYIPQKLNNDNFYSNWGNNALALLFVFVLILQSITGFVLVKFFNI